MFDLEMNKEYDPTDFVYPACLPDSNFNQYEDVRVNVSGWGSLKEEITVKWLKHFNNMYTCL
jgi:hypothetical protein